MHILAACNAVLAAWRANPFEADETQRHLAEQALELYQPRRLVAAMLDEGLPNRASKLVLALGHRRACAAPDSPDVALDCLPDRLFTRLPFKRGAYLRVAAAAGRCYFALDAMTGDSEAMRELRRQVWAACFGHSLRRALQMERVIRDHDVLLLGETGTGKELVANALLAGAPGPPDGSPAPRASLNAAAVPETLIESELFGHVKGAFTGATEARAGRIRSADGGCLFLDEVGDLPSNTQVKLLRVIETNEVHPLGSDKTAQVEVRYIAATHKDLVGMAERGEFRQDLYERMAGNIIRLPPLRERPDDIPAIGHAFVLRYLGAGLTDDDDVDRVDRWLRSPTTRAYPWPGNARELQNALRNLMLGLPAGLKGSTPKGAIGPEVPPAIAQGTAPMRSVRDWYLHFVLDRCEGNLSEASRVLGVDRTTVRRQLDRKA